MLIIDRIENGFAVCENQDKNFITLEIIKSIKGEIKEGDVLILLGDFWIKDEKETKKRREVAINLQKKLFGE